MIRILIYADFTEGAMVQKLSYAQIAQALEELEGLVEVDHRFLDQVGLAGVDLDLRLGLGAALRSQIGVLRLLLRPSLLHVRGH